MPIIRIIPALVLILDGALLIPRIVKNDLHTKKAVQIFTKPSQYQNTKRLNY